MAGHQQPTVPVLNLGLNMHHQECSTPGDMSLDHGEIPLLDPSSDSALSPAGRHPADGAERDSHRAWTVWAGLVSPLPGDSLITDVFVPDSVLGDKNEMLSRLMCRCCP